MNWSCRYARETVPALLADAGLAPVANYVSADERFVMALARVAG